MNKLVSKKKKEYLLSSDDSFEEKLKCHRSKKEKKRKIEKEVIKINETVEQKRDRRLKKKIFKV